MKEKTSVSIRKVQAVLGQSEVGKCSMGLARRNSKNPSVIHLYTKGKDKQ